MGVVWCVFFVSADTLEWELSSIHATCELATRAAKEYDLDGDGYEDDWQVKIEKWEVSS